MGKSAAEPGAMARISEEMALDLMRVGSGSRKKVFQQLQEGLRTGNIAARTPIIQSQVEAALQQGGQAVRGTEEQVAKAGASRTGVGQETIASTRNIAQQAIAAIPSEVIGQTVGGAPRITQNAANAAFGLMGTAGGLQGQAAQANASADAANQQAAGSAAATIGTIIAAI